MRMRGRTPHYAHVWDELLTAGHRLWGFANDGPCPPWPDVLIAFTEKVESLDG